MGYRVNRVFIGAEHTTQCRTLLSPLAFVLRVHVIEASIVGTEVVESLIEVLHTQIVAAIFLASSDPSMFATEGY